MEQKENKQKIKLLLIMDLLRRETDGEHPMTTKDLCSFLLEKGIKCDRRTLYQDMELLAAFGFSVNKRYVGHSMGYYYEGARFTEDELRFLVDAAEAAAFLPASDAQALQKKIMALGTQLGLHVSENALHFNTLKRTSSDVFSTVSVLGKAIDEGKRIAFKYFDLNEKHERVFRKLGRRYILDPVSIIYNDGNYYLTVYSEKYGASSVYRVDRMAEVETLEEPVRPEAVALRKATGQNISEMFHMYAGETEEVSLRFPDRLLGPVYDKFGDSIQVSRLSENVLEAEATVQLSPTFFGWLFQFAGEMKITGPAKAIRLYKKAVMKAAEPFLKEE